MKQAFVSLLVYHFLSGFVICEYMQPNLIYPCFCDNEYVTLHCKDLEDENILTEIFPLLTDSNFEIFRVSNSVLSFIPVDAELFGNTTTVHVSQTSLDFLLADFPPPKLDTIIMDDVEFQFGFSWEYLEDLRSVRNILIRNVEIPELDSEFERSVSRHLSTLMLKNTNTSFLSEEVFKKFVYAKDLRIESASIRELNRIMFPRPAELLTILSFEDNMISYLPKDFFADMPNLRNVDFSFNYLKEMPISLFRDIKNLQFLSLEENPLECNCNMRWIAWKRITWEESFSRQLDGVCNGPHNLSGVELRDLTPDDFEACPSIKFTKLLKTVLEAHVRQLQRFPTN